MNVRAVLFLIILTFCLSGCLEDEKSVSTSNSLSLDTPAGMRSYLSGQYLPALESVEIWENEYGPGLKLITDHYEIYTTLLEPLMLTQVPGFMESAYRGYNNQLPRPISTVARFTVYLFGEREEWEKFTDKFAGRQAYMYHQIKKGAYYLKGACVVYNIGRKRTFSVLGHEGWHQFNSRHFKYRLPSWLDEGIAMQFEISRYDKGKFYFEPAQNGYRLGSVKKALIKNEMIPLGQLITLNPGEVILTNDDAVAAFYGQSYALVRFLREEDYGKRLGDFHQMLMGGVRGEWQLDKTVRRIAENRNIPLTVRWNRVIGPQLFQQYIGSNIEQIEQEYIRYCRKNVYRVRLK